MDNTLAYYGGAVKALGGGKIAGYGVLFTNEPDLEGDCFTKETNLGMEVGERRALYYRHGVHPIIKDRTLGKATLTQVDEAGAFFEGELNLRDDYDKYIYKLVEMGKLGFSTGSMPHLVRKEARVDGKSKEVKSWPLGEISLTPSPVEPRTVVFAVKSLADGEVDELDTIIKEEETKEVEFDVDGIPSLKEFCEAVAPDSTKNGTERSQIAANAVKGYLTHTRILGEAFDSYTSRLVKRTEHRFLKENRDIDSSTITQVEKAIAEIEKFEPAYLSIKESLIGIRKISEMSKAEQKAMDQKAKLALWNYHRVSGYMPEELNDGRDSS